MDGHGGSDTSHQEDTDDDTEDAIGQEYFRLQRKLRKVEREANVCQDESEKTFRLQRIETDVLLAEHKQLSWQLEAVSTKPNLIRNRINSEKITALIKIMNDIKKDTKVATKRISKLDEKIKEIEKNIRKAEKENGANIDEELATLMKKRMRLLENNLQEKIKRFNTELAKNCKLREELDHYRTQKAKYDAKYRKSYTKLRRTTNQHSVFLKEASDAYSLRDDVVTKLMSMESRDENETVSYSVEMQELGRLISHTAKLQKFMFTKLNDRAAYKEEEEVKRDRANSARNESETDGARMARYNAVFAQLQEVTGIPDLNAITKSFVQRDQENFAMFQYIHELCDEEMRIKEDVQKVRDQVKTLQDRDTATATERDNDIKRLEDKGNETEKKADAAEQKLAEVNQQLQVLIEGIGSLFHCLGCDDSCITNMLGYGGGLGDNTVMQYMGLIEQKTTELLGTQHLLDMLKRNPQMLKKDSEISFIFRHFEPCEIPRVHIKPPDFRIEPTLPHPDKPLTLDDLRVYALKAIAQADLEETQVRRGSCPSIRSRSP